MQLFNTGQLFKIVFDEIHKVLTDVSYRTSFLNSPLLNLAGCQIIGLSASLPPHLIDDMHAATKNNWRVIRMPSNRKELAYEIRVHKKSELLNEIVKFVNSVLKYYGKKDRALIFCRSVDDAQTLAFRLEVQAYYSGQNLDVLKAFVAGKQRVLPTTSALGVGFHYDSIRHVLHYKLGYSILDHYQEDSRGGRDGRICQAITFMAESAIKVASQAKYDVGEFALQEWARQRSKCLRIIPSMFMDGVAVTCHLMEQAEYCATCLDAEDQEPPTHPIYLPTLPYLLERPSSTTISTSLDDPQTTKRPLVERGVDRPAKRIRHEDTSVLNERKVACLIPWEVSLRLF